jgi:hypothetical protein
MIRSRRFLALFLLAGLFLAPVASHGAAKMPSRKYVHVTLGFSFKRIADWSETPIRVDFKARGVVAKFKAESRGGDFASLDISRFGVDLTETTPSEDEPAAEDPQAEIARAMRQANQAKSAEDALRSLVEGVTSQINGMAQRMSLDPLPACELPKPRKVKLGKATGLIYTIEIEHPKIRWGNAKFCCVAGIARQNQEEYLLLFRCAPNQRKKYEKSFQASIRSFRFASDTKARKPAKAKPEETPTWDEDSKYLDPAKRARIKKDAAQYKDWRTYDTPHYLILHHAKDKNLSRYVAKRIEILRTKCWEVDFPPVKPITSVMVIRLCPDKGTYHHYGGPGGTGGYWASGHDEFVFPSFSGKDREDDTTYGVLHHEGWHQYFHYALEGRPTPIAMNEGLAEFYFCAEPRGRKVKIGNRHSMRHGVVKTAASTGKLIPFKTFIRLTQREHYSKASLCYSEGWALFYWLLRGTKNPVYKEIPIKLFRALAEQPQRGGFAQKPWLSAVDKVLEGIDEDKLHADFLKGIKKVM